MEIAKGLIGRIIGQYHILDYIGTGTISHVFNALHTSLGRRVVIKILFPEFIADDKFFALFNREARNQAKLSHPNIAQIYDFNLTSEFIYMITEYIEGQSLKEVIDQTEEGDEIMPIHKSVKVIKSVASALSYAHGQNIIHQNINSKNIIIENTDRIVLTDFGFSNQLNQKTEKITGKLRWDPAYCSPEQAKGDILTEASDIYSLGVVFYHLTTGQLPFIAENPLAITAKHIKEPVPQPRSINKEISKRIEHIILKALSKRPSARHKSIDRMLREINNLREAKTEHLPTASLGRSGRRSTELDKEQGGRQRVVLHILETGQILELPEGDIFTIGRNHEKSDTYPDIDLTPFKGLEWGISRMHAKLVIDKGVIQVIDLGSMNGTRVGGKRIEPNIPFELHHSDIVSLGKLKMQVLVYDGPKK